MFETKGKMVGESKIVGFQRKHERKNISKGSCSWNR